MGIKTIGFLGGGGALFGLVDLPLSVRSKDTPRIQEAHLLWIHILSEILDNAEQKKL